MIAIAVCAALGIFAHAGFTIWTAYIACRAADFNSVTAASWFAIVLCWWFSLPIMAHILVVALQDMSRQ